MNSAIGVTHAAYLRGGTCSVAVGDGIYFINLVVPYLCKELNNCRHNDMDGKFKIYVLNNIYFKYFPAGKSNKIVVINPLEMKRNFFHVKFVPRIKLSVSITCVV